MGRAFKLFFISAALFGILVVFFCLFDSSTFDAYLADFITGKLSSPSVAFTANGLSLLLLGLRVSTLNITFMKLFFALNLEHVSMDCLSSSLLWGAPRCTVEADLYGGTLASDMTVGRNEAVIHTASLQGIIISKQPQLSALGMTGGILDASTHETFVKQGVFQTEQTSVALKNLVLPNEVTLSPHLTGIPFPIPVPALTIETISADILSGPTIKNLEFSSSLGTATGSMDLGKAPSLQLILSLSQKGLETLQLPLSFICPANVLSAGSRISLQGPFSHLHCSVAT